MQITSGIYRILSAPFVYSLYQRLIGANRCRREFMARYVHAGPTDRVLDIGCGPSEILNSLTSADYVGIDISFPYLQRAKKQGRPRANFVCGTMECLRQERSPAFDIVLGIGLLHHLNDDEVRSFFRTASALLRRGGRTITFDGCFTPHQNKIARFFAQRDRGKNVRTEMAYADLAKPFFEKVETDVRHDLLYIPYTHCIMQCYRDQ